MKKYSKIPPCPDPDRYQLITTHEGKYWRLKRGLGKPAKLNPTLTIHAKALAVASKAASRLLHVLQPHMGGIHTGRIKTRFATLLKKQFIENGEADFSLFKFQDFQPRFPYESLLVGYPKLVREKQKIGIRIEPTDSSGMFRKKNTIINGFDCKLILLSGNPLEEKLPHIRVTKSEVILADDNTTSIELWLSLPRKKIPWMLVLKISGYEDNAPAIHARHYAMKVLDTGI